MSNPYLPIRRIGRRNGNSDMTTHLTSSQIFTFQELPKPFVAATRHALDLTSPQPSHAANERSLAGTAVASIAAAFDHLNHKAGIR